MNLGRGRCGPGCLRPMAKLRCSSATSHRGTRCLDFGDTTSSTSTDERATQSKIDPWTSIGMVDRVSAPSRGRDERRGDVHHKGKSRQDPTVHAEFPGSGSLGISLDVIRRSADPGDEPTGLNFIENLWLATGDRKLPDDRVIRPGLRVKPGRICPTRAELCQPG